MHTSTAGPGDETPRKVRWHLIYYVLAGFDLLAVTLGLVLSHRIMTIYTGSVDVNREWSSRVRRYTELAEMAARVNSPGNDVFDSHDIERESARLREALGAFNELLEAARADARSGVPDDLKESLLHAMDSIEASMADMLREADLIFAFFRQDRPDQAGERMATMDHRFYALNAAIFALTDRVLNIQQELFRQQTAQARSLRSGEALIAGLIVLMVGAVTVYGHKLARKIAGDEAARDRAGRQLRESETRMRAILDAAPDGMVIVDAEGKVESFNRSAERMFGCAASEIVGRGLGVLLPRLGEGADPLGAFRSAGGGEARHGREAEGRRKDGSPLPLELSVSSVELGSHRVFTAIVRDITERKQAERELREARQAAEAADRAKGAFLATMSHEIRTPINGIVGMTGLLRQTELDDGQRESVETVRSCADSLLAIVNDILDFSKIEAGRLDLESIDFDVRAIVEEAVEVFAHRAHEKGIDLVGSVAIDVPSRVQGDPGRLRQVLLNLVGNAVKFTERGEVLLTAHQEAGREDQVVLGFRVSDTGIGIPAGRTQELFRPFSQIDASTTRRYGGTGLGLAISSQLVHLMGGRLGVDSEVGRGSTFHFSVAFRASPDAQEEAPDPGLLGVRVLVVEDHPSSRRAVAALLSRLGCLPAEAGDARRARALLREAARGGRPLSAALLDERMPDADGRTLMRCMDEDPLLAGTRRILMAAPGFRASGAETGFSAVVSKPVRRGPLEAALRAALDLGGGPPPPSRNASRRPSAAGAAAGKSGGRILLAEDNTANQKVVLRILEKFGYQADAVSDGGEAVEALSLAPYDLVLMDCRMPVLDGFEATREIRRREGAGRRTTIVAMTAGAMIGDRERCLEAGMDDYLMKPFGPEELARVLERWLPRAALGSAATAAVRPARDASGSDDDLPRSW